jgi:hypothetical protein
MKHVTSMSKARPKQAISLPDLGGLGDIKGMLGSMADSIFKTPDEKADKGLALPSKPAE